MTDFHSHILPNVDDGSKSLEEGLKMLELLSAQGVNRVVATPHFYPNRYSVAEFLEKRNSAYKQLKPHVTTNHPQIVLGAEVKFYDGISRLENLDNLFVENTDILLIEMPFERWSEYTVKQLINLSASGVCTVVIAHIDRYIRFQSKTVLYELIRNGILFQANAEAFKRFFDKRRMLKLLKEHQIHFIGTDCHNLTDRAPNIDVALSVISKKFGEQFLEDLINSQNQIFVL